MTDEREIKNVTRYERKPVEVKDPFSNANFVRGYESGYADAKREQKPAEWSEEDKRILKGIIGLIDHNQHYNVSNKEMLKWLKSLRPSWKPTEEQIYSLGTVVKGYNECTVGSVGYRLKELYEQLKKL